jgi:hypothetical protein
MKKRIHTTDRGAREVVIGHEGIGRDEIVLERRPSGTNTVSETTVAPPPEAPTPPPPITSILETSEFATFLRAVANETLGSLFGTPSAFKWHCLGDPAYLPYLSDNRADGSISPTGVRVHPYAWAGGQSSFKFAVEESSRNPGVDDILSYMREYYVAIDPSPTGNCQISSLSNFQHFLPHNWGCDAVSMTGDIIMPDKNFSLRYFRRLAGGAIVRHVNKAMVLLDVKDSFLTPALLISHMPPVLHARYVSTNGSHMNLVLHRVTHINIAKEMAVSEREQNEWATFIRTRYGTSR